MKTNNFKMGDRGMGEERIYEEDDLPRNNGPRCGCADHEFGKDLGGVGVWASFPQNTVVYGAEGDCGCYYQICSRCGEVKMHGIHSHS